MAANSSSRLIARAAVFNHIRLLSARLSPLTLRRAAYSSVYDKNPDEHVRPSFAPDDVITPEPEKFWGPNPLTGVFGPEKEHNSTLAAEPGAVKGSETSVLEEKAWYRPTHIEDVEKPHLT